MHETTRHEVFISINTRVGGWSGGERGGAGESRCKSFVCRGVTSAKSSDHPVFLPTCLRAASNSAYYMTGVDKWDHFVRLRAGA